MAARLCLLLALTLLCTTVSCGGGTPVPDGPSIVFVTLDTLRQDHLSRNGHSRQTTPNLDRLAEESVYHSQCYAQAPWTLPSMLSMFSSLPPPIFGAHEGVKRMLEMGLDHGNEQVLLEYFSDQHLMLPEVLSAHGYHTAGFSTNGHLTVQQGFVQGFDHFDQTSAMWGSAGSILVVAEGWLDRYLAAEGDAPFFLWVHLFDPHFDEFGSPPEYTAPEGYESLFDSPATVTAESVTRLAYDRKIRYADDQLGEFLDSLRERGVLDRSLVVIAADHGEEFNEDGRWGHSRSLRDELVHVPLMFRYPGAQYRGDQGAAVSNMDIAPTILQAVGIDIPASMEGNGLAAMHQGQELKPWPIYGETRRNQLNLRFLVDPVRERKLVLDMDTGRVQLFTIGQHSGAVKDLASEERRTAEYLELFLRNEIKDMQSRAVHTTKEHTLSNEEIERLKELGYLK